MDVIECCLQALAYERSGRHDSDDPNDHFERYENLDEFFATAAPRLRTPIGEHPFEDLKSPPSRILVANAGSDRRRGLRRDASPSRDR